MTATDALEAAAVPPPAPANEPEPALGPEADTDTAGAGPGRIRLDMNDLTLGELADAGELIGGSLSDALQGPAQSRAMAAVACVIRRRTDPSFTFADALNLRMADLEVIGADPTGATGGAGPPPSPESGS